MISFQYLTLKDTIHQEYHDVVERRVFTVTGARADEEIMNTLAEIQERHDAIRDLERKLLDLQQVSS
ncbi:hypothetical protein DVH24_027792 [Malus domestica]|uniref:Syntaxin N-terminal domain-containing protein n=1 Tax=Malus domestica TaxID=3750 RepID=A0A498HDY0_MALDO|nr:hypothetical protein DVH24_027792 [Malus domestica]